MWKKIPRATQPARKTLPTRLLRVLIVEDNLINQKLLSRVVEVGGHSVEIADDGEQAVLRVRDDSFDLVFMDVQMPGMDGLEATRQIRNAQEEAGSRLPIVGVTAGATAAELEACLASGMDFCITKPIAISEVEKVLARVSAGRFASVRGGATYRS